MLVLVLLFIRGIFLFPVDLLNFVYAILVNFFVLRWLNPDLTLCLYLQLVDPRNHEDFNTSMDFVANSFRDSVVTSFADSDSNSVTQAATEQPRRPQSSYFHFRREKLPEVKAQNPNIRITKISKKLGELWKALSDEEKRNYQEMARRDRERYEREKAKKGKGE
jgi:hypothetical protein